MPILPAVLDPRLITVRRGGTLTDEHHRLLAEWAALCAEHILTFVIAGNKIRLVNLNGSRVGRLNASIGGTLIVNALWQAVRTVQAG